MSRKSATRATLGVATVVVTLLSLAILALSGVHAQAESQQSVPQIKAGQLSVPVRQQVEAPVTGDLPQPAAPAPAPTPSCDDVPPGTPPPFDCLVAQGDGLSQITAHLNIEGLTWLRLCGANKVPSPYGLVVDDNHPLHVPAASDAVTDCQPPPPPSPKTPIPQSGASSNEGSSAPSYTGANDPDGNRALGQRMAAERGWTGGQWSCLDTLWGSRESGWDVYATNPNSGAYGIPQALPGNKMGSAGSDWRDNPQTQIAWGLGYIASTYGTPCGAKAHSDATGGY